MSQQDSIKKEVVIRGVLASLVDVQGAPRIDPGELVIFLEKEANDWCNDQAVELTPLWYFCVHRKQWTEGHFERLCQSLRQLFSYHSIMWTPPDVQKSGVFLESPSIDEPLSAVSLPRSSEEELNAALDLLTPSDSVAELPALTSAQEKPTSQSPLQAVPFSSDDEQPIPKIPQQERIIDWIVSAVKQSRIHEIIDPSKLEEFLQHSLVDMWDNGALHLQELWLVLAEPEDVTNDMLVCTFLLLELNLPQPLSTFSIHWPPLLKGLGMSQRVAIIKSMGLEPPASWFSAPTGGGTSVAAYSGLGGESKGSARAEMRIDSKPPASAQDAKVFPDHRKASGSHQAFSGSNTGSFSLKEADSAPKSQRSKKTDSPKSTKSPTTTSQRSKNNAAATQGISVPRWLLILAGILLVGGIGYYLMYGPVSLSGEPMNVRAYSEYVPLYDLRILGTTVQAMPKSSFFLDSESVQQSKLNLLYTHIKNNNSFVTGLAVYSLRGKFLKNYIPPQPPKTKKPEPPRTENP